MIGRALPLCALMVGGFACWTDVRPARPDLPPRQGGDGPEGGGGEAKAAAAPTAPPTTVVPEVSTEELEPPLPTLRFSETAGASQASVKRWFAAAPSRLGRCKGLQGNTVTVYVTARDGDVFASLDDSSADANATACVLETIAFELDNAFTASTSPSERPNTVESMIILSW